MHAMKAYLPPLARLLMSGLFIWDGILQLRDPSGTAKYFASVHVPIPDVAVWISIVIHLLAGLGILVGFRFGGRLLRSSFFAEAPPLASTWRPGTSTT